MCLTFFSCLVVAVTSNRHVLTGVNKREAAIQHIFASSSYSGCTGPSRQDRENQFNSNGKTGPGTAPKAHAFIGRGVIGEHRPLRIAWTPLTPAVKHGQGVEFPSLAGAIPVRHRIHKALLTWRISVSNLMICTFCSISICDYLLLPSSWEEIVVRVYLLP